MSRLKQSALMLAVVLVSACQFVPGTDANRIARFQDEVRAQIGDTGFKKVWVEGDAVCAEIGHTYTKNAFQAAGGPLEIEPPINLTISELDAFSDFADRFLGTCHPGFARARA